jgi:hypothetical protein
VPESRGGGREALRSHDPSSASMPAAGVDFITRRLFSIYTCCVSQDRDLFCIEIENSTSTTIMRITDKATSFCKNAEGLSSGW